MKSKEREKKPFTVLTRNSFFFFFFAGLGLSARAIRFFRQSYSFISTATDFFIITTYIRKVHASAHKCVRVCLCMCVCALARARVRVRVHYLLPQSMNVITVSAAVVYTYSSKGSQIDGLTCTTTTLNRISGIVALPSQRAS